MRLLVCGDRNWSNEGQDWCDLANAIERLKPSVIIEGGARGADECAASIAIDLGIANETYPAEWEKYGKPGMPPRRAAGPIRNKQMLDEGKPDLVLYAHHNLSNSKGTKNMVNQAGETGVPVISVKVVTELSDETLKDLLEVMLNETS